MAARRPYLSKSKLISAWQCRKRLYLEKHHPEQAVVSARTQSMFNSGQQVGAAARKLYAAPGSATIEFDKRVPMMLAKTRQLLDDAAKAPIFEATFRHENVLVRADVMLPEPDGWRLIEVKASTSVKDYHLVDCAIQDWVVRSQGVNVTSIALAHIDNRFVYPGGGDYRGLLVESDLTSEVRALEPAVPELVAAAREAISGPLPAVDVGAHCNRPFECPFIAHCWPTESAYPIAGLGGSKAGLGRLVAAGCRDIRDVAAGDITAETQRRIHRVTCSGEPEILPGAGEAFAAMAYPRFFLDFETIAPAVPFWTGTRPYAPVAVQWSCHVDDGGGDGSAASLEHHEFLDLSGAAPMRELTLALIDCLGSKGPVLMWTTYEATVIRELIRHCPDLAGQLQTILERLVDMQPIVKAHYYHPNMLGSWSIKAVMPTIDAGMDYARLDGIREGTAAADGFIEAIDPATAAARKAELDIQLRRYCRFDTEAMVEIARFFQRRG